MYRDTFDGIEYKKIIQCFKFIYISGVPTFQNFWIRH